jgi:hypothetical protein
MLLPSGRPCAIGDIDKPFIAYSDPNILYKPDLNPWFM